MLSRRSWLTGSLARLAALCGWKPKPDVVWIDEELPRGFISTFKSAGVIQPCQPVYWINARLIANPDSKPLIHKTSVRFDG